MWEEKNGAGGIYFRKAGCIREVLKLRPKDEKLAMIKIENTAFQTKNKQYKQRPCGWGKRGMFEELKKQYGWNMLNPKEGF